MFNERTGEFVHWLFDEMAPVIKEAALKLQKPTESSGGAMSRQATDILAEFFGGQEEDN